MFSRVPIRTTLEHVANPDEWARFQSCGDVTSTDLWINSLAAGGPSSPGRLDDYEPLARKLVGEVHRKLASGEWLGEGFDPSRGAELQRIDQHLWRVLEIDLHEEAASGAGFEFVSLLISSDQRPTEELNNAAVSAVKLTGRVPLQDLLPLIATTEERDEYIRLNCGDPSPRMWILGGPESDWERSYRFCDELQGRLWGRVLPRLIAGEWLGRGLRAGTIDISPIPSILWSTLRCDFPKGEVWEVRGSNLRFYHTTIEETGSVPGERPWSTPGSLRRRLTAWIQEQANAGRAPVRKEDLLKEARAFFAPEGISRNMFMETYKAAQVPASFRIVGRPRR
jgi:hypothetical protein